MDGVVPERSKLVGRRRLLALAGFAGLTAAVTSACSRTDSTDSSTSSTPPSGSSADPPNAITDSRTSMAAAISGVMLCRDSWGAQPARPGGLPHSLTRMTIHHTAAALGANSNAPARLRQHQRYHQDSQGWIDVAYHVSVDRDGNIFELRRPELAGDTATSYDPAGHFLVVCEGNFDEEFVSEAQLRGATIAFAWAAQQFGIATETLAGHRDVSGDTACPGTNLYAYVRSGDLKRRVDELMATGTVDLKTVCGPEAAAIVAAIENGS